MPVGELRQRMSQGEFIRWTMYYARRAQREELARKMQKHTK